MNPQFHIRRVFHAQERLPLSYNRYYQGCAQNLSLVLDWQRQRLLNHQRVVTITINHLNFQRSASGIVQRQVKLSLNTIKLTHICDRLITRTSCRLITLK